MSVDRQTRYATREEAAEARRAAIRANVARHAARLKEMTKLEQAAYKARAALGEEYDPYTAEERAEAERVRDLQRQLVDAAASLNAKLQERLASAVGADPRLAGLLAAVQGAGERVEVAPY